MRPILASFATLILVACSSSHPGSTGSSSSASTTGAASTSSSSSGSTGSSTGGTGSGSTTTGSSTGGSSGASSTGGSGSTGTDYLPDPTVTGHVLEVCPSGCTYSLPSAALAAAVDGDTIQIDAGQYTDCAYVTANNVIIRGVPDASGARPRVGGKVCGRKGIFVVQSTSVLIENLELADAVDPTTQDQNWACVRFDSTAAARNLKLRNCWLHDADDGLLGNNTSTAPNALVIEGSLFENLGRAGYAHGMYVGTAVDLFVLRNSVVRHNHDDGHLVKTRALKTIVECNTIAALDGLNSYAIDIPQGGDATVRNNVIEQGPNINNGGDFMINFAEENGNNAPHKLVVQNNQFINDYSGQGQIHIAVTTADTSGWASNTYVGPGGSMRLTNYTGPDSFTNFADRASAGLPAYDGTMASLPRPPSCP